MHPNEELIKKFYTSFQQRDPDGMTACYDPEIVFSDPVFPNLKGERAIAMWHMLLGRSKDIEVTFRDIQADEQSGIAYWEARYTYSATGRKVHNVVTARFRFLNGKIIVHQDTFDIRKWATQALGTSGLLLGWTPLMRRAISRKALKTLAAYMTDAPSPASSR